MNESNECWLAYHGSCSVPMWCERLCHETIPGYYEEEIGKIGD